MKINAIKAPRHGFKLSDTSPENIQAVEAYLRSVNGKADAHTTSAFTSIQAVAKWAEGELDRAEVSKTARPGCTAYQCDGGAAQQAYKYQLIVTGIRLKRFRDGWRFMSAHRTTSRPLEPDTFIARIPERYIEAIKKKAVGDLRPLRKKVASAQPPASQAVAA